MRQRTIAKCEQAVEMMEQKGLTLHAVTKKLKIGNNTLYQYLKETKRTVKPYEKPKKATFKDSVGETDSAVILPVSNPSLASRVLHSNLELQDKITVLEMAYGL